MYRVQSMCWLVSSFLIVAPIAAQDVSCLHRTLTLNVFDTQGRVIRGLDPSDFEAKFRGKPVSVLSVTPDSRPHRIAVLLDTSGTVLGQPDAEEWVTAHSIASHISRTTLGNTSLALLLFSDKVNEQIDFAKDPRVVADRLSAIGNDPSYAKEYLRGSTAVRDAVLAAMQLFGKPGFSDSIYVIGDGSDNKSRNGFHDVRDALVSKGVRLYFSMLSFGSVAGLSGWSRRSEESDPKESSDLAVASGGLVLGRLGLGPFRKERYNLTGNQRSSTEAALNSMYLGMTRNDLVEIELPHAVDNWTKWSLELSPQQKKAHKDRFVIYPQELAPCSALPH
jgi:hypothetical protein